MEEEDEEEPEEEDDEEGEDNESAPEGGSPGSPGDGRTRPFIILAIWTVNDFKPTMTTNIFKNLWDRYQIPENVPICLPSKSCGVVLMVGTVSLLLTSSFSAIDPNISPRPKGFTILR